MIAIPFCQQICRAISTATQMAYQAYMVRIPSLHKAALLICSTVLQHDHCVNFLMLGDSVVHCFAFLAIHHLYTTCYKVVGNYYFYDVGCISI